MLSSRARCTYTGKTLEPPCSLVWPGAPIQVRHWSHHALVNLSQPLGPSSETKQHSYNTTFSTNILILYTENVLNRVLTVVPH